MSLLRTPRTRVRSASSRVRGEKLTGTHLSAVESTETTTDDATAALEPSDQWRVFRGVMICPLTNLRFELVRHGLDRHAATDAAGSSRVVFGDFPNATEITGDIRATAAALRDVTTSGAHFTNYASLYSDGAASVLLIDYIH
ncbi:hypothetical protein [Glaciihabitans sp. dw_435]|uniref:hypothetical protein n=1 Tax=Glaciihabitans sp. dw_435 TaxID=2720081 RepID=UPI001BD1BD35|nr:hypothetical protein [Glaciihabitans sp. dw_435]